MPDAKSNPGAGQSESLVLFLVTLWPVRAGKKGGQRQTLNMEHWQSDNRAAEDRVAPDKPVSLARFPRLIKEQARTFKRSGTYENGQV